MKKKILLIVLALILIGGGVVYYQWNKPKRTAADEKPVASLAADDLYTQFVNDEVGCNAKYNNKVVEVKGRILSFEAKEPEVTEGQPKPKSEFIIYLETSDMIGTVSCTLVPGETAAVKEGQDVTIKGICNGYLTDVVLTQCALVQ
jgi:cbb3-type cytochrome oxidase subunit 3